MNSDYFKLIFKRRETIIVLFIFTTAFCLRLLILAQSDNFDGLSIGRTIKAIDILNNPGIFRNFDPGHTPLPNYLFAMALLLWNDPFITPRIASLLFGSFLIFPYYGYVKLIFDKRTALFSTLIVCFYPLHVIYSTLSSGDTLFHFFLFSSFYLFMKFKLEAQGYFYLILSALLIGCAFLTRFEGGLFIPLLTLFLLREKKKDLSLFLVTAIILPAAWMFVSYRVTGDPLSFVHTVERIVAPQLNLHREISRLPFDFLDRVLAWPKMLYSTLTPSVALLGFLGLSYSLLKRKRLHPALSFLALLSLFTYKGIREEILFLDRYGIAMAFLLIPFSVLLMKQLIHRIHQQSTTFLLTIFVIHLGCVMIPTAIKQKHIYPFFTKEIGSYLAQHVKEKDKILLDSTGDDNFVEAIIMNSKVFEKERIFRYPRKVVEQQLRIDKEETIRILSQEQPRFIVYAPEGRFLTEFFNFSLMNEQEESHGVTFKLVFESNPFRVYEAFYPNR